MLTAGSNRSAWQIRPQASKGLVRASSGLALAGVFMLDLIGCQAFNGSI
jgi:hypothetical protein